eukprot:3806443-Alexandrium_andersonii.AAC.1
MADGQEIPRGGGARVADAIRVLSEHVDVDVRPTPSDRPDVHWEHEEVERVLAREAEPPWWRPIEEN